MIYARYWTLIKPKKMLKKLFKGGLECHSKEILAAFVKALDEAFIFEFDTAGQVSDEEWEAIRPTKIDRRNSLLKSVQVFKKKIKITFSKVVF